MKKVNGRLVPMYESDRDKMSKLRDDVLSVDIKQPRNPLFHRKFFALLNLAFENQERYDSMDTYRPIMIMKAGRYEEVHTDKGLVFLPKSISFSSMDQAEFEDLYSKMIDVVIKELGCDEQFIEEELINFM